MMTPKQALVKDGFLPKGSENQRGRLSLKAIERCKELAASGVSIKGYEVTKASNSRTASAPVEVKKVKATNEKVIEEFTLLYDVDKYHARSNSGKFYSLREVCNNCRVSMVQCHCRFPTILGGIAVEIRPKT